MTDPSPNRAAEPFTGVNGAWYVVALLAISNGVSFFDRGFIALTIDPIKSTLHVTDTQIGLMIGPAFIIFYSTVSLPIARLADAHNRKRIILAGMLFWSVCTAMCGMARNLVVLGAARMGVGLGEAALVPAGVSIIGDMLPRDKLGRAVSIFTAGGILGGSLASILGGLLMLWLTGVGNIRLPVLGHMEPWQTAFLIISLPGILLGFVIAVTMREPIRRISAYEKPTQSTREATAYLWAHKRAVLATILGFAMVSALSGVGTWTPTFFMRTFNLTAAQVGASIGIFSLVLGTLGAVAGGSLADALRRRGREDANILVAIIALVIMLPLSIGSFTINDVVISMTLMAIKTLVLSMAFGVAHPCVSLAAPASMRSQAVAMYLLCANTIGIGFVPLLVPILTDYVFRDPLAVRYSLVIVSAIATPIAVGFLLIARKAFVVHVGAMSAEAAAAARRAEATSNATPLMAASGPTPASAI